MHHLSEILKAHPAPKGIGADSIKNVVASLSECSLSCYACADACLGEEMVDKLRACITTDIACAETTRAFANILTRQSATEAAVIQSMAQACEVACRSCAEECEKHAEKHAHCAHCAKICRECETHCSALKKTL